ncbi:MULTISPECIES: DUF503 domain-containing protein [Heyndrickxia]|jgi:uncharacterized protein YlxP (DUF503 family)|uniref:DUF503 family protein n=2 Tax=Heyndrickxia coagulans TaxID=1398 RepID=A0A133K9K9_HEYCO|nr:DUF503 family protein [Heyndrickxia coagulans]AEH53238.1 protein of unknown function DUF503 [Heyndrickxia coagulans 2-6]AJH79310.1 hypothetical protein BF29_205 [Heyndrickxia coagulans DSM 1 = ATCC 7050]KWZ76266.1 hypothetical protein HMPREF3213_04019 [Heyndrickxia coagulans]KYC59698.1 hypothetical protein B4098_0072 [Heyndrickxia coagulans]MBF8418666.1 DUF503 family protein [Heyndrickxia coagulans]
MIGSARCEFRIYDARSLKEKRAVLQRILTRLKQKYNVAAGEMDFQDIWQRTLVEVVTVASSRAAAERELQRAIQFLDSFPEWERLETNIEWL